MRGIGEECLHLLRVLLDRQTLIRRVDTLGEYLKPGVVAVVVLGDGVGEPGQIPGCSRDIRLPAPQRGVGGGLLRQSANQKVQLDQCRFLHPQRAVIIEDRDARLGSDVIRALGGDPAHEVDDRRFSGPVTPGNQARQAQLPADPRALFIFSTAAEMVNDAGSARGGNSLNVSRNRNTSALAYRQRKIRSTTQPQ